MRIGGYFFGSVVVRLLSRGSPAHGRTVAAQSGFKSNGSLAVVPSGLRKGLAGRLPGKTERRPGCSRVTITELLKLLIPEMI